MSNFISKNLKILRKNMGLSQAELAQKTGLSRANIGSYEEGRAEPKVDVLQKLASFFKITVDELINNNKGDLHPHILSIVTDKDNNEKIVIVPDKASAGYTKGYADTEYIEKLPTFNLPLPELSKNRTYRVFQIKGESMLPVKPGSYIICEYVADISGINEVEPCIIVTRADGLLFKRILKKDNEQLLLKSDNAEFEPYFIEKQNVIEIWKSVGYISFDFPAESEISLNDLHNSIKEIKLGLNDLKKMGKIYK